MNFEYEFLIIVNSYQLPLAISAACISVVCASKLLQLVGEQLVQVLQVEVFPAALRQVALEDLLGCLVGIFAENFVFELLEHPFKRRRVSLDLFLVKIVVNRLVWL